MSASGTAGPLIGSIPQFNGTEATEGHFHKTFGTDTITVTKEKSAYELEVYRHPDIASSPFFPRLFSTAPCDAENCLAMTLSRLQEPGEYISYPLLKDKSGQTNRILSKLLLDLMGALRTLHGAGYVHSDVSINNIGYNRSVGLWQLFDFDRAMPIEESRKTKRPSGTEWFTSRHASENGIFDIMDDYIAMQNTWHCVRFSEPYSHLFMKDRENTFGTFRYSFSDSAVRCNVNVDVDELYLRAFETYCKAWDYPANDTDPSYLIGRQICTEIELAKLLIRAN